MAVALGLHRMQGVRDEGVSTYLQVRVPFKLHRNVKSQAALDSVAMRDWIVDALEMELRRRCAK